MVKCKYIYGGGRGRISRKHVANGKKGVHCIDCIDSITANDVSNNIDFQDNDINRIRKTNHYVTDKKMTQLVEFTTHHSHIISCQLLTDFRSCFHSILVSLSLSLSLSNLIKYQDTYLCGELKREMFKQLIRRSK